MTDILKACEKLVARILDGDGFASRGQRKAAFKNSDLGGPVGALVNKVAMNARGVTQGEIAAVRAAGLNEDQVFEIVICSAVGQATRQYERAVRALEAAVREG